MFAPWRWIPGIALAVGLASNASAAILDNLSAVQSTVSFTKISSNSPIDVASQLTVEVYDPGALFDGSVIMKVLNSGPLDSSICDIYFDDGTLVHTYIALPGDSGSGVSFSTGASPGDLSGGNSITPVFDVTGSLSADSDAPVSFEGINPGEYLFVELQLLSGKTVADTVAALQDGSLRIGLHVQALSDEESDGYIGTPPDESTLPGLPEPTSIAAWLIGAGAFGLILRRRVKMDAA